MALPVDLGATSSLFQQTDFPQMPQMATPPSRGMFGGGGNWQNALLAALAGFMMRRRPQIAQSILEPLQQGQILRQKLQEAQIERQQRNEDQFGNFQRQYDYELAHPKPQQPSDFETYAQQGGYVPGTPAYAALMKQRADEMANPVVMTPYGPMRYSDVAGAAGTPAPQGVTFTAIPPNGGPTPPASGGFPVP